MPYVFTVAHSGTSLAVTSGRAHLVSLTHKACLSPHKRGQIWPPAPLAGTAVTMCRAVFTSKGCESYLEREMVTCSQFDRARFSWVRLERVQTQHPEPVRCSTELGPGGPEPRGESSTVAKSPRLSFSSANERLVFMSVVRRVEAWVSNRVSERKQRQKRERPEEPPNGEYSVGGYTKWELRDSQSPFSCKGNCRTERLQSS